MFYYISFNTCLHFRYVIVSFTRNKRVGLHSVWENSTGLFKIR